MTIQNFCYSQRSSFLFVRLLCIQKFDQSQYRIFVCHVTSSAGLSVEYYIKCFANYIVEDSIFPQYLCTLHPVLFHIYISTTYISINILYITSFLNWRRVGDGCIQEDTEKLASIEKQLLHFTYNPHSSINELYNYFLYHNEYQSPAMAPFTSIENSTCELNFRGSLLASVRAFIT